MESMGADYYGKQRFRGFYSLELPEHIARSRQRHRDPVASFATGLLLPENVVIVDRTYGTPRRETALQNGPLRRTRTSEVHCMISFGNIT